MCLKCIYFIFCRWYMQREGNENECDWIPGRFKLKVVQ